MNTILIKVKETFSFQQFVSGNAVRFFADNCHHLKKLNMGDRTENLDDDDIIYVIDRLGKQLTTLVLDWSGLTDVTFLYLKNCAR